MKTDILREDQYTLGVEYTLKGINSEFLAMSCYGYHFDHWEDEDGNNLSDMESLTITKTSKSLSAQWKRNIYWAFFYNDTEKTEKLEELSALYLGDVEDSGSIPTPTKEGYRLRGWSGGNYKKISVDLDMIADWVAQCYLTWAHSETPTVAVCSLTCEEGTAVTYPPLSDFQKPFYTVSSWSDTSYQISARAGSNAILAEDIQNTLNVTRTDPGTQVTYKDDKYYSISVENVVKTPYYDTPVTILYRENGGEWRTTPFVYHELTNVTAEISVGADNYFPYTYSQEFKIVNGTSFNVVFRFLTENDAISTVTKSAYEDRDIPEEDIPVPSEKTLRKIYTGWDDITKTKNLKKNEEVSALYEDRYYTVNYFWDDVGDRELITIKTALYQGDAYHPGPTPDGYVFQGWGKNPTGRTSTERVIYADNLLSSITEDNLSVYSFLRKIHPLKLYNVVDNVVHVSALPEDMSSVIDYEYLDSSKIGLSNVQYHSFEKWNPSPNAEGKWLIDHDNYEISAIYKADTGTLTYHSHYPEYSL